MIRVLVPILLAAAAPAMAANPSALWEIAHDRCVPHEQTAHDPAPCALVDLTEGYVILKDIVGATQFLLIPTDRIGGIESSVLLKPETANYFADAWRARHFTEDKAGKPLPREAISLAVNSAYGRSQNQLHIHIDCPRVDVRDALAANREAIGRDWSAFPMKLAGQPWRAIRVDGEDLAGANPFRLLAERDKRAADDMANHTLVVAGITWADGTPGFAILDGEADLMTLNRGSGEILQDHDCALAR